MRLVEDENDPEYAARVIFTGTVVRRDDLFPGPTISSLDPIYWTFVVDDVERGTVGERFTISSARSDASCGMDFLLGHRYRVLAWGGNDPARPEVTGGDAQLLPRVANPPSIEGDFGPPWRDVLLAYAADPFTWVQVLAFGLVVVLVPFAIVKRWRGPDRPPAA